MKLKKAELDRKQFKELKKRYNKTKYALTSSTDVANEKVKRKSQKKTTKKFLML
jgi:hypothetical protein